MLRHTMQPLMCKTSVSMLWEAATSARHEYLQVHAFCNQPKAPGC